MKKLKSLPTATIAVGELLLSSSVAQANVARPDHQARASAPASAIAPCAALPLLVSTGPRTLAASATLTLAPKAPSPSPPPKRRDQLLTTAQAHSSSAPPVAPAHAPAPGFLRLDTGLLSIAAQASPPLAETKDDPRKLAKWIKDLPTGDKDKLLRRVAQGHGAQVQMELQRRFRGDPSPTSD